MGLIKLITGGARSGKSAFAESLLKNSNDVIYIATGIAFDEEMKNRIAEHKSSRNQNWLTLEGYKSFSELLKGRLDPKEYILLDCVTIMVSNLMTLENDIDWDTADQKTINNAERTVQNHMNEFLKIARDFSGETIIVTNELGMGIVPPTTLGRYYRDIAGRINQMIAETADEVYFVVSGIPVKIK